MTLRRWGWLAGIPLLLMQSAAGVSDDAAKPRLFIGSIDTTPESREALQTFLKERGFTGAFVPEGAAANSLLYRGTKQEYESALEAAWKYKPAASPEKVKKTLKGLPTPKRAVRDDDQLTDEEAMTKLSLSPLQQELTAALLKESAKRSEEFKDQPPTQEMVQKGLELIRWKRKSLREILTRDQYAEYFRLYQAEAPQAELGPVPKLPKADAAAKKTDEAIFARLGLSAKQKEALDKHLAWKKKATEEFIKLCEGHMEEGQKLNEKWRSGLDRILTKVQRQQYADYWGPPPERMLP